MLLSIVVQLLWELVLWHRSSSIELVAVLLSRWLVLSSGLWQQLRRVIGRLARLRHIRPRTRRPWRHCAELVVERMLTRGCWSVEWFPVEIWLEFIPKIGGVVHLGGGGWAKNRFTG